MKYHTRQQEILLNCLKKHQDVFLSVEQFMDYFHHQGMDIGRTTVYRILERLQEEGDVLKIPSVEGAPAMYRLLGEDDKTNYGKLVCLKCGKKVPMQCGCMDSLMEHTLKEHEFELDKKRTIFYGTCRQCKEKKNQ